MNEILMCKIWIKSNNSQFKDNSQEASNFKAGRHSELQTMVYGSTTAQ